MPAGSSGSPCIAMAWRGSAYAPVGHGASSRPAASAAEHRAEGSSVTREGDRCVVDESSEVITMFPVRLYSIAESGYQAGPAASRCCRIWRQDSPVGGTRSSAGLAPTASEREEY